MFYIITKKEKDAVWENLEKREREGIDKNPIPSPYKIHCKKCTADVGNTAQYPNGDLYAQFKAENILFYHQNAELAPMKQFAQYLKGYPQLEVKIPKQQTAYGDLLSGGESGNISEERKQIHQTAVIKNIQRGVNDNNNNNNNSKDLVKTLPRNYQIEMYEKAMERDTICCLPTGIISTHYFPISIYGITQSLCLFLISR